MISTHNTESTLNRDIIGYKSADSLHLGFLSLHSGGIFTCVDQLCIPMTIPIKFVVDHASTYHQVRNLYRKLDETMNIEAREDLRIKIQDKLLSIFDENEGQIK